MDHAPLIIKIPFEPVPTARARVTRWGTYDEQEPLKITLKMLLHIQMNKYPGWILLDGPLVAELIFNIKRPKKHYRAGKFSHLLNNKAMKAYPSKGDFDNYAKFVCDAMSGIVYVDDKQIVDGRSGKQYADAGKEGSVEIQILPWDGKRMKLSGSIL